MAYSLHSFMHCYSSLKKQIESSGFPPVYYRPGGPPVLSFLPARLSVGCLFRASNRRVFFFLHHWRLVQKEKWLAPSISNVAVHHCSISNYTAPLPLRGIISSTASFSKLSGGNPASVSCSSFGATWSPSCRATFVLGHRNF